VAYGFPNIWGRILNVGTYELQNGELAEHCALHSSRRLSRASLSEIRLTNDRSVILGERDMEIVGGVPPDFSELRRKDETFRLLFDCNPVATLVHDCSTGQILSANEAACSYFGYEAGAMAGMPTHLLFPEPVRERAAAMLACERRSTDQCWQMVRHDGSTMETIVSRRLSQVKGFDVMVLSIFDVTDRRRIEQRMAYMASHDELTGLANRAHFREHLRDTLHRAAGDETTTIALIDLDHFKTVNDAYGHHFGDAVLTEAALRMRGLIPPEALLSRIGGDEFAIIFRHSDLMQVQSAARTLIAALSEPFHVKGSAIHIGATIGFASSPHDSTDPETLLRYAALALDAAKVEQRGTCKAFEARFEDVAQERNKLEQDFRLAIMEGELQVHYQPIVNLDTGAVECYEALTRWHHRERGPVSPEVFIPLAEEIGLIDQLGHFVLQTACREAMNWPETVKLSVNVSPLQFRNGNLLTTVVNALAASGLRAERLELEITEAVLMEQGPRPAAIIRSLRAFGIGVSLDDFGTGYSSLSYLLTYPFTKIKIDKSFVLSLQNETSSRAVIRAVIGLGRSLGLTVAAEGIEREIERDYLRSEGCGQGQGFLFGRAESAHALSVAGKHGAA
jgi:diguanylate cyclase (GGDEF)-like protein/PAS domain S-box-containing protein